MTVSQLRQLGVTVALVDLTSARLTYGGWTAWATMWPWSQRQGVPGSAGADRREGRLGPARPPFQSKASGPQLLCWIGAAAAPPGPRTRAAGTGPARPAPPGASTGAERLQKLFHSGTAVGPALEGCEAFRAKASAFGLHNPQVPAGVRLLAVQPGGGQGGSLTMACSPGTAVGPAWKVRGFQGEGAMPLA
jgi:hypothetical protein